MLIAGQVRFPLHALPEIMELDQDAWDFIGAHTAAVPGLSRLQPLALRAMVHYVTWNRMIEQSASWRYRVEDADVGFVCAQAGLLLDRCYNHVDETELEPLRAAPTAGGEGRRHRHGARNSNDAAHAQPQDRALLDWSDLTAISVEWTAALKSMAVRYGYDRHGWQPRIPIDASEDIAV